MGTERREEFCGAILSPGVLVERREAEREYEQFLEEVGLNPDAVNNRGIEVVEEEG